MSDCKPSRSRSLIGSYEYFGGKMLKNAGGWINQDRLGSIGKFFPYGQDRGTTPLANGQEKFATYTRDSETGLDYAQNRYHSAGDGRFLTPDPFGGSANAGNPGSWNRYAYVGGDPVGRLGPGGLCDVVIGGITQSGDTALGNVALNTGANQAYPYAEGGVAGDFASIVGVANALAVQTTVDAITAAAQDPGPINIVTYSGGADALKQALLSLSESITSRIASVIYLGPGTVGSLPFTGTGSTVPTSVFWGVGGASFAAQFASLTVSSQVTHTNCPHTQTDCFTGAASAAIANRTSNPCSNPSVFSRSSAPITYRTRGRGGWIPILPPTVVTPGFGQATPFSAGSGGGDTGLGYYDFWAWQNAGYASAYFGSEAWMAPYLSHLGSATSTMTGWAIAP